MSKPNVTVTLAGNGDAEDVERLVLAAGFEVPGVEWGNLYPHWLVARIDDDIVGCMEVLLGRPIGRLEHLSLDQGLGARAHAAVLRSLSIQGMMTLRSYGADLCSSMIPFEDKAWKKALKKRGATVMATGSMLVRRLN